MLPITVLRTTHPRAWGSAAAAAFIAGLAAATVAGTGPVEPTRRSVASSPASTLAAGRIADAIALRPDPADPSRLVVDFGPTASGGAFDPSTYAAVSVELVRADGSERWSDGSPDQAESDQERMVVPATRPDPVTGQRTDPGGSG